jgi:hypothetical protein
MSIWEDVYGENRRKSVLEMPIIILFEIAIIPVKMTVFCVVAKCSLVEINRRFGGIYCFQHQSDEQAACEKACEDKG